MRSFWLGMWWRWALWVTLFSILVALITDIALTFGIYLLKGVPPLNATVFEALLEIGRFWFGILWSITLLLALFLSVKRLFNRCIAGRQMHLFTCKDHERINPVLMGDVVVLWRRWMILLIWVVTVETLAVSGVGYLWGIEGFWSWFDIYWLYAFLVIASALTLPLLPSRCKRIEVVSC